MKSTIEIRQFFLPVLGILALFFLSRSYSYLLFHNIAEALSIIVSVSVFVLIWNSRSFMENNYFIFLGISFIFIAITDFLHSLAYFGMGIFPGYGKDLPTQLWIIARYIQAVSFLIAPAFLTGKVNIRLTFAAFTFATAGSIAAAFFRIFPSCFVEGQGLTGFKVASEYIICVIFIVAAYELFKKHQYIDDEIFLFMIGSIALSILAELSFTLYTDVYDFFNMTGHYLKILSFLLIYKGIIEIGLKKPYSLLYRELKQREEALQEALNEVKTLRKILPICANCKKIRDDKGYWTQVEEYISDHVEVEFSHGLCPECARKLYPTIKI
jgi:hypothetical protein